MDDCPHGHEKRTCETCELEAERDHERGLRQGLDRLANTLFEERDEARAERDRLRAVVRWMQECTSCPACRRKATETLMGLDVSADMGKPEEETPR